MDRDSSLVWKHLKKLQSIGETFKKKLERVVASFDYFLFGEVLHPVIIVLIFFFGSYLYEAAKRSCKKHKKNQYFSD